ncbi:hypothetical protein [Methylobacterium platani]|uniref:Uncharacterized protein n=2 Tax=Methylobacterium platani TaxID=427683 RepID=A0A179S0Z4_9HYPH|nr:hypothetical protein [Methylobacterium platani]KMO17999.1 hypothetical protein SQ03_11105 [Methylobacterium platani JCM 14648]OAS18942.1 hypothetical protein A5481_25390 [Methylobacterium platani]
MLLDEVTDALGVGGLFRDVMKPLDVYLSNGECEAGHATVRAAAGPATADRDGVARRETVRRVPEAVSARR